MLSSVESKLSASRVESAKLRWNACSVAKNASKAKEYVGSVIVATSENFTDATKKNVLIITLELLGALKLVSTQIKMSSKTVTSRIRAGSSATIVRRYGMWQLVVPCCTIV